MFASVVMATEMKEVDCKLKEIDHFEKEESFEIVAALDTSESVELIRFELSRKDKQFCWKETTSVLSITESVVDLVHLSNGSYLLATELSAVNFDKDLNQISHTRHDNTLKLKLKLIRCLPDSRGENLLMTYEVNSIPNDIKFSKVIEVESETPESSTIIVYNTQECKSIDLSAAVLLKG